jgi:uncharacterized integral membrane protein
MAYQYKRIRPSIIRNLWVYRRVVGSAILLGLMLWFVWANNTPVTVAFPFRLGHLDSALGVVILLSAIVGSLSTVLIMTVVRTARKIRAPQTSTVAQNPSELAVDRPPPDYAVKTTEGFPSAPWSR